MSIKWKELVSLVQLKLVSFVTVGRNQFFPLDVRTSKAIHKKRTKTLKKLIDIVQTVS